ncbi:hypothetical protein [Dyadobacter psychrotolerans]|uniref:Uncharacterized protein n=1 Tax=Dyadobacter psychrotolerans TaxID=2541721 RepID=A0A4R5DSM8_9BACT|nr:hypothetical protein [Dyadobacter psychrotolerans]TDE17359.1 hypothetical protein E0F88_05570 [Dyadobacter psychrotolerans]
MGLLEWFFESRNPGPVGKVGINPPEPDDEGEPPRKWLIYVAIVVGLILAGTALSWVFEDSAYIGFKQNLYRLCLFFLYVLVGHFVSAKPDHTNIGWLGGLVDNPFRISDDFNRWVLFTQIILLPGKLIAYSLVMSLIIGRHFFKKLKQRL